MEWRVDGGRWTVDAGLASTMGWDGMGWEGKERQKPKKIKGADKGGKEESSSARFEKSERNVESLNQFLASNEVPS